MFGGRHYFTHTIVSKLTQALIYLAAAVVVGFVHFPKLLANIAGAVRAVQSSTAFTDVGIEFAKLRHGARLMFVSFTERVMRRDFEMTHWAVHSTFVSFSFFVGVAVLR